MNAPYPSAPAAAGAPPCWLPWFRLPARVRRGVWRGALRVERAVGGLPAWLALGALIGGLPLWLGYATGLRVATPLSAAMLTPLLVAAAARDRPSRGCALLGAAFLAHNALAVLLVARDGPAMAPLLPDGQDYWRRSERWITTGVDREYEPSWWVPAHAQLLLATVAFTYVSLGSSTLSQGFYEVDLMNFYVGSLASRSHDPWLAVALGWHPWSICRGLGYLILTYEVTSLSLSRFCGVPLSPPGRRLRRWAAGLALLLTDGVMKFLLLDVVRRVLAHNLA